MMPACADSQLGSPIIPARSVFGVEYAKADESVRPLDLSLTSLGSHITLAVLHQSQIEHCPSDLSDACPLRRNVSSKRRNEFILGRAAARLALIRAGSPNPFPVMRRAGGDPDWPAGIVGSITHSGPWAIAAVASRSCIWILGIDLEDVLSIPEMEIAETVCRASELRWVFERGDSRLRTAMLFSAKESVYKALYPWCQQFFDFHAVELTWIPEQNTFRGVLLTELNDEFSLGFCFEVHCQQIGHFVFTYLTINADDYGGWNKSSAIVRTGTNIADKADTG
jgi:enterobactin synthetase component D